MGAMTILNPAGVSTTTLFFTALASSSGTDAMGNALQSSVTVRVDAIVTPLSAARLQDISAAIGVDPVGIPVKVRVQSWPATIRSQAPAIASLTYNGRPAQIRLAPIREQHPVTAVAMPNLGQSCEGILTYS